MDNESFPIKDGWMTCDFTSFLTVFQSYQDGGQMIKKAMCNGTLFRFEKIPASSRSPIQDCYISGPVLDPLSYQGSPLWKMDKWMVCKIMSFLTEFVILSRQWVVIMEGCVQQILFTIEEVLATSRSQTQTRWISRLALKPLSYWSSSLWKKFIGFTKQN